ncbi:hypothetical protein DR864_06465 [Runella rosea]|uniref:DUF4402 domain-containing protein n=1 Tax=Runella rosea TaxID=2259595 RepID=A0A344TFH8_9BACT|nr:hypothetical protein [Runella rosea]AXE17399.1 hypothetical protein DR864_06465 [Runella rosea]
MKKLNFFFIIFCFWGICGNLSAQNSTILPSSLQLPNVATLGSCTASQKGQLVLLTTDNKTYYCNGSAWQALLTGVNPWSVNGTHIYNNNSGNVGIGIQSPTQKLDIVGNIKLTGEVNATPTGTYNLVPIAVASVQDNGILLTGTSNIGTIETVSAGYKRITITGQTLSIGANSVVGSVFSAFPAFVSFLIIDGKLEIKTYNSSGTLQNAPFSFTIYKE